MIFVFFRITSFFLASNIIFPNSTPKLLKIYLSMFLSLVVSMNLNYSIEITNIYSILVYTLSEISTGLILGYITSISFSSLRIAGKLIDQQIGLTMSSIFDPQSNSQSSLIENLLYWTGVLIFFQINGHHAIIVGIINSFELINLGSFIIQDNLNYILYIVLQYFIIGIKIAAPVVIALLMAELIMGIVSRSVPQINVMVLGVPLKLLVGMFIISIMLPVFFREFSNLFSNIPSILDGTFKDASLMLSPIGVFLFADDKTEDPTPKKKNEAKKKGNVPKSKELSNAITLCGVLAILSIFIINMIKSFQQILIKFLTIDMNMAINEMSIKNIMSQSILDFMRLFLPSALIIMVLGILANLLQSGIRFNGEGLKPNFSKINPLEGFKNMFSMNTFVEALKNIAVVTILGIVGYNFFKENFIDILKSGDIYFPNISYWVINLIKSLVTKILMASIAIGAIDYGYQVYRNKKSLKMTKEEVKEEYKQSEGNPEIKGKIKQKQREMASRRMMSSVPSSTVIVTNPTHLSIALRYEKGKDSAPVVLAKGEGHIAMKIREIAKENKVPIIENKPLARMIYKSVDINTEVPSEMYELVAEVLVSVYKIKNRYK